MIYCPYTNKDIHPSLSNIEHIIPLSLGGADAFTINVDASFNAKVGSDIDGVLANDFLILQRRIESRVKGHSNKRPVAMVKRSTMGEDKKPVQVEFFGPDGFRAFDPVQKRDLTEKEMIGQKFNSKIQLSRHGRLKFAAKVALSAGHFIFGDWFRHNVNHTEVRALMNFNSFSRKEDFQNYQLKGYDEFTPNEKPEDDRQRAMDEAMFRVIDGSGVYFCPGPVNLGMTVGVLGKVVATLNIPANTDHFPHSEENDLGHAIVIERGVMQRMSYRSFAKLCLDRLGGPS